MSGASLPPLASPVQSRGTRFTPGYFLRLLAFCAVLAVLGFFFVAGYLAQYLSITVRALPATTPAAVGLHFEDVTFPAQADSIPIRGWWIPANSDRTVLLLHGKDSHRAGGPALDVARFLHDAGYNTLLFDFRGSGESGGDRFSLGHFEVRDVSGAIDYLEAQHPTSARNVAVIGFSMGASTGVLAAGQDARIDAVIEDSGYADVVDLLEREIPRQSNLPGIITWPVIWMGRILQGYDISAVRPVRYMDELAGRPFLIIHGGQDGVVPVVHAERLIAAAEAARLEAGAPLETWLVPRAGHVGAYAHDPATYRDRVVGFLNRAFGPRVLDRNAA